MSFAVISGTGSSILTPRGSCSSFTVALPSNGRLIFNVPVISPFLPCSTEVRSSSIERYGSAIFKSTNSLDTRTRPIPLYASPPVVDPFIAIRYVPAAALSLA